MSKEQLIALGLTEEQADKVIEGYGQMVPKNRLDEKIEEVKELKTQISNRDTQLTDLQTKAAGNESLQAEITKLQTANKEASEKYESELKQIKVNSAVDLALTNAKARNLKAAKALLDLSEVELDEQGNIKGLEEKIKSLTEDEGTKFMFDSGEVQITGTTPGGTANLGENKPDTSKMSYSELVAFMEANPGVEI